VQRELGDGEEQQEGVLDEGRQRVPQDPRDEHDGVERRVVHDLAGDDRDDGEHHHPADDPADPVPRPRRQPALRQPLGTAPDLLNPELVVGRPVLADQEVRLMQHLEPGEHEYPPAELRLEPDRVDEPDQRVVRHQRPDQQDPDDGEQDQPFNPVPEGNRPSGQDVLVFRPPALIGESLRGRQLGLLHVELPTVNDVMTVLMAFSFCV
jgi:hypothetical protein